MTAESSKRSGILLQKIATDSKNDDLTYHVFNLGDAVANLATSYSSGILTIENQDGNTNQR